MHTRFTSGVDEVQRNICGCRCVSQQKLQAKIKDKDRDFSSEAEEKAKAKDTHSWPQAIQVQSLMAQ